MATKTELQKQISDIEVLLKSESDAYVARVKQLTDAKTAAQKALDAIPVIDVGTTFVDLVGLKQVKGAVYKLRPGEHRLKGNNLVLDGVTFDGAGDGKNVAKVIQTSLSGDAACFDIQWRNSVTLRNLLMQCDPNHHQFGVLGGATTKAKLYDLSIVDRSGTLLQLNGDVLNPDAPMSDDITLGGIFGGIGDQYICYLDKTKNLKIDRKLHITHGVTSQCAFRVNGIYGFSALDANVGAELIIDGRPGLALYYKLNKEAADAGQKPVFAKAPTSGRFHAGADWLLDIVTTFGIDGWGPMGGDDGGIKNLTKTRLVELGLRLKNVRIRNYNHVGPLSLNPGLLNAAFNTGSSTNLKTSGLTGVFFSITDRYPLTKDTRSGDTLRTSPEATFGPNYIFINEAGNDLGFDRAKYPKIKVAGNKLNGASL